MHQPVGRMQFEVFEKFTSAFVHQIPVEVMLLNINNLHVKASHKVKTDKKFWRRVVFVICTRDASLHSRYMKNALVFSQSEARNYFIYTRNGIITVCVVKSQVSFSNLTSPTWIETYCEILFSRNSLGNLYLWEDSFSHPLYPVYRSTESVFKTWIYAFVVVENHERSTFRRSEILIFIYY